LSGAAERHLDAPEYALMPEALPTFDVFHRELSTAELDRLFEQLESARVLAVIVRERGAQSAESEPVSLAQARARLAGCSTQVQVRYVFEGIEWWDTIIPTNAGCRVVRIAHSPTTLPTM
jgi:hypothetical protein